MTPADITPALLIVALLILCGRMSLWQFVKMAEQDLMLGPIAWLVASVYGFILAMYATTLVGWTW